MTPAGSLKRWLARVIPFQRWVVLVLWCFAAYGVVDLWKVIL